MKYRLRTDTTKTPSQDPVSRKPGLAPGFFHACTIVVALPLVVAAKAGPVRRLELGRRSRGVGQRTASGPFSTTAARAAEAGAARWSGPRVAAAAARGLWRSAEAVMGSVVGRSAGHTSPVARCAIFLTPVLSGATVRLSIRISASAPWLCQACCTGTGVKKKPGRWAGFFNSAGSLHPSSGC